MDPKFSNTIDLLESDSNVVFVNNKTFVVNGFRQPHRFIHPIKRNVHLQKKTMEVNANEIEDFRTVLSYFQRQVPNPESFTQVHSCGDDDPIDYLLNHVPPFGALSRTTAHNHHILTGVHHKLTSKSSAISFCNLAGEKDTLHRYSWPVALVRNIEGAEKIHKKRRREMVQVVSNPNDDFRVGEFLNQGIKHFIPVGKGNHLVWEETALLIPPLLCDDAPFRIPTMSVQNLATSVFTEIENVAALSKFHDCMNKILSGKIALSNIFQSNIEDLKNISESLHKPLDQQKFDLRSLRNKVILGLLGRHFEGITDATIHMIFSILKPYLQMCSDMDNQPSNQESSIRISDHPHNKRTDRVIKYRSRGNAYEVDLQLNQSEVRSINVDCTATNHNYYQSRKRRFDSAEFQGSHNYYTSPFQAKCHLSVEDLLKLKSLRASQGPEDPLVSWKHILFALQNVSDTKIAPVSSSSNLHHVHELLPSLCINETLVERVKHRLLGIYSKTEVPGISKQQPQILARSELNSRISDDLEKKLIH